MKITSVTVAIDNKGHSDVSFFFDDGIEEPWGIDEFQRGTPTRIALERLEQLIYDFNAGIESVGPLVEQDPMERLITNLEIALDTYKRSKRR